MTKEYADRIRPLLKKAQRAYGSRATASENHEASREYTRLLVEYYEKRGSLLKLAEELEVAYAGLRRRVTTHQIPPNHRTKRVQIRPEVYARAVVRLQTLKDGGDVAAYHDQIKVFYDAGLSLTVLAREMGMSSAHPLYYGLSRATMRASK